MAGGGHYAAFLTAFTALAAAIAGAAPAAAGEPPAVTAGSRPRIGLALGGGGARGAAHIGVLRVLEELRVPIDCVAGTSMGALVGAAYASGMDSGEIERLVGSIDWAATLGSTTARDLQPVALKTAQQTYSNRLEFGVRDHSLLTPGGLVPSQQVDSLLRSIVSRARYLDSFDELPIPFRAVATDVRTGDMLVLDGGDLATAMRASMAVPGAFAPVRVDGQVMVDGGLVRNLPVDVARGLCADVVIASSLASDQPDVDKLQSVLEVLGQTVDVMIKNNEKAQLATLDSGDVAVIIRIDGMSSAQFDKVPVAIPAGDAAARAAAGQLARYSLPPEEYAAWRAGVARAVPPPAPLVAEIRIEGTQRVNPEAVRRVLRTQTGQPLDEAMVVVDAQRIYAMGDFEGVDHNVSLQPQGAVLEFHPSEKPWGPDYLRFDLGLMSATGGDTGFILRADHTRTWVNSLGGRWANVLQLGREALVETRFQQPLDLGRRRFVEAGLVARRSMEDLYRSGDRVARYEYRMGEVSFDAGLAFGNRAELRGGIRFSRNDFTVDTGSTLLPEADSVDASGLAARFVIDGRDSHYLPTRGSYLKLDYFSAEPALGADDSYRRIELFGQHVVPFRGDLVYFEAAGGSDLGSDAPGYDLFTLGGVGQLAGFQDQELRGREYAFGRVAYLRKLKDLQVLLGQALYAGVSLEAGNMYEQIDGSDPRGLILASSVFIGGRTLLGPVILKLGFAEGGHAAAYLQIGRPLYER